ncbi:MAG: hypothetical protein DSY82_00495 [Flavobacteriia bacterium]|nr:MAG: hypothetical protein DSY82_00495 [Flavobacteriia bacterium]
MKKKYFLILFMFSAICFAQEYKPYKIKSGKIEYEVWKYKISSHYSNHNGEEKRWKEAMPYVVEIIDFYWDDYGDKTFEQNWIVAEPHGQQIPKIPNYELLTTKGKKYYFNYQDYTYREDPDHVRSECMERYNFYQLTGSWVKTVYGGYEKGEQNVLGKNCSYYQANEVLDLYIWKGLPLKEDTFKTNREGKRLNIESTRMATDIQTGLVFDKMMFDPIRIQPDRDFIRLNIDDIGEMIDADQNKLRQIDESGYEIREGDVILYVTSDYRLGKLRVLRIRRNEMNIRFVTYDSVGSIFNESSDLCIKNNFTCDLDGGTISKNRMYQQDFRYKFQDKPMLIPFPNYGFYLIKSSRKK